MIDRPNLMAWLNSLRLEDGSFMMHQVDGEVDIRGVYCALSVARLTNIFTAGNYSGDLNTKHVPCSIGGPHGSEFEV